MTHSRYQQTITELKNQGSFRFLRQEIPENMCNLSSNDYLGIQQNQELYDEFLDELYVENHKFSAASSRLLTGNHSQYTQLEILLAQMYNREAALVFNSGYHANCGILPAIANKNDIIIADKLVHASIIDGLTLGSAKFERFRHCDYNHLEKLLEKHARNYEHVFIVTESVFSMDGDCADIPKLIALKKKYNAFLYVDEAHAVGVRGSQGLGLVEEYNCIHDCDFIVGTFGKAISSVGAFVICDEIFKSFLINHSRTLIYTTALPPISIAWTRFIMQQLPYFQKQRENLQLLAQEFSKLLQVPATSHIIPYIIGENDKAISIAKELQTQGFFVLPIRYPTVAKHTARLRFSLHANISHSELHTIATFLSKKA